MEGQTATARNRIKNNEKEKGEKHSGKLFRTKDIRCLLTLDLKPFRLSIKRKYSAGRQS